MIPFVPASETFLYNQHVLITINSAEWGIIFTVRYKDPEHQHCYIGHEDSAAGRLQRSCRQAGSSEELCLEASDSLDEASDETADEQKAVSQSEAPVAAAAQTQQKPETMEMGPQQHRGIDETWASKSQSSVSAQCSSVEAEGCSVSVAHFRLKLKQAHSWSIFSSNRRSSLLVHNRCSPPDSCWCWISLSCFFLLMTPWTIQMSLPVGFCTNLQYLVVIVVRNLMAFLSTCI